jgi:8-oxo-dGTP pyrophosphatase MutT (NUDIX family)
VGILSIRDATARIRETRPAWTPDWRVWIRRVGDNDFVPLADVLAERETGALEDWQVRYKDIPVAGIESVVVTDDQDSPLWDQPVFMARPDGPPGAIAVPWFHDGPTVTVGLLKEYRPVVRSIADRGAGTVVTGVPRGFRNFGETAAAAASRELLEETGLHALRLDPIGEVIPDTTWTPVAVPIFAAEVDPVEARTPNADPLEQIKGFSFIPLAELMARTDIVCGFTTTALFFLLRYLAREQIIGLDVK